VSNSGESKAKKLSAYERMQELKARQMSDLAQGKKSRSSKSTSSVRGMAKTVSPRELADSLNKERKLIYGVDDRQDYYQLLSGSPERSECDSIVSLWESSDVQDAGDGQSDLQTSKFADSQNLCEQEIFREQPVGAFCSGFLVDKDVIATAGHCVDEENLTSVRFVFGYRMETQNQSKATVKNSEVYSAKEIIGRKLEDGLGSDWCLVKLDRPVTNHKAFNIRKSGKIGNRQKVHVIGHPCGLPLKYAGGAWVRDNEDDPYFVANLDTYGGNSGSCVINDDTGEVEGILVRGDTDFVSLGDCRVSNVCPTTGCRGEDCTRTTEFADKFKA
jgi:V8-like Glu-specific endopeptidase